MLALWRARFRVYHDIRRDNLAYALFDSVAERMHLFEAGSPRDADRGIHEMAVAGAANAHAVDVQDSVHSSHRHRYFLLQTLGSHIQQRIQCSLAELRANPQNNGGNGEACERVRVSKPRQVPRLAGPD